MNSPEYLEAIMGLIMYGGEAKGFASKAIQATKEGRIDEAEQSPPRRNSFIEYCP